MSVRYNYNGQLSPPAPFVYVTISRPDELSITVSDVPAQLDSGADMSVIPANLVERLQLVQLDQAPVAGFGGHVTLAPTYLVGLAVRPFDAVVARVIADRDEPFVLLGRDVLNRHHVELDGQI
jgi:hypothetical protein